MPENFSVRSRLGRALAAWLLLIGLMPRILITQAQELNPPSAPDISTSILISEVQFDAPQSGSENAYEWFELYNIGTITATLNNWKVVDNGTSVRTFTTTIAPRSLVVVSPNPLSFTANYPGVVCPVVNLAASVGSGLANTGDRLVLSDTTNSLIDALSYGSDTSVMNPAINISGSSDGASIERLNEVDTDTANDWRVNATASPCTFISTTNVVTPVRIHDIQGTAHLSVLAGSNVNSVPGVVTAKYRNGFYFQDPLPDGDPKTSEAMWVFTNVTPTVSLGDSVLVTGTVDEYRPGGSDGTTNLTQTEIKNPTISIVLSGTAMPTATVLGLGGRVPPDLVISDDAISGSVEISGTVFDPSNDGIDFYESLEGMLVQVNNAVAVGPTYSNQSFDQETPIVADNGVSATLRNARGGVTIRADDFNPERIILNAYALGGGLPDMNVGDKVTTPITGIMDYSYGNFKLVVLAPFTVTDVILPKEITTATLKNEVSVATFNVENLAPSDAQSKFDKLAGIIVTNLKAPDIIAIEEVQDNTGSTNDGTVDATLTFTKLITTIQTVGGITYGFRQINPLNNSDGGAVGGNIRVGFLFRTDRGLQFIDRAGGTSTAAVSPVLNNGEVQLNVSPGRISPSSVFFNSTRKSLVGEFEFKGNKLFVVVNHFSSKRGDPPLFGRYQPPIRTSEITRTQQAALVNQFVQQVLALDASAHLVMLGDFNDYQFSSALAALKGNELHNLMDNLPEAERYSYVFEGNAQVLDQILASKPMSNTTAPSYDVVHVNSEYTDGNRSSDHDPQVARFSYVPKAATLLISPTQTGVATYTLRITALDILGEPVPNALVTLTTTLGTLSPISATTNISGVIISTLSVPAGLLNVSVVASANNNKASASLAVKQIRRVHLPVVKK